MANPIRGEVAFTAQDQTYTLSFGINAIIEIEEATGQKFNQILSELAATPDEPDFDLFRSLFWGALIDNHDLSPKDAGKIMTAVGFERASELITQAIQAAFEPPKEAAKGNGRPRKAARTGTG